MSATNVFGIDADKIIRALQTDSGKAMEILKSGGTQVVERLKTDPAARNLAVGLGVGALAGVLAGKSGGKFAGAAVKLGGVAALGGLAYQAYRRYLAQKDGAPMPDTSNIEAPPEATGYIASESDAASRNRIGKAILRAMIGAVKADGQIDSAERAALFDRLGLVELTEDEQNFLFTELAKPLNFDELTQDVHSAEEAAQVYAAAAVSIDPDLPAERNFLAQLAQRLGIDPSLAAQINDQARDAA